MADNNELQIVLSLDDQASAQAKQAFKGINEEGKKAASAVSESLENMGKSLQSVGREIGHVSTSLAFLGAGIVAPFALALNEASKSSINVSNEMMRLKSVTDELQNEIATAVLPVVHQFADNLKALLDAFNSLPEATRNAILQTTLFTGEIVLAVAAVGLLSKEILILIANITILSGKFLAWIAIPANAWLVGITAGVIVLAGAFIYLKDVATSIINVFEQMFNLLLNGVNVVKIGMIGMGEVVVDALEGIVTAIGKIPGPQQKMIQGWGKGLDEARQQLEGLAKENLQDILNQTLKINQITETGKGSWSNAWNQMRDAALSHFAAVKKGTNDIVVDTKNAEKELINLSNQNRDLFIANINKKYLEEKKDLTESINLAKFYQANWMQAHAGVKAFAIDAAMAVKTNLTTAISGIITGAMTAKEAFTQLGQAMIKMVVDYFVQKAISMALDFAFGKAALAASVATQIGAAAAITAAFAPAALAANIASFGGAAVAAAATFPVAASAEIAAMAAATGAGGAHLAEGTDTVPAMLSPGEMVFPRSMADAIRSGDISVSGRNGSGSGNGDITINLNGITINSKENIRQLAEELGFEIKRKLRGARSNL